MRERIKQVFTAEQMKSGSLQEACNRYGVGKANMRRIAEDAHAIIRIGKSVIVNYSLIDKYLDSISE